MDEADQLAGAWLAQQSMLGRHQRKNLADHIRAYGEQCRRAGAEEVRRKAAAECEDAYSGDIPTEPELQTGEIIKERIMGLPLPPATKAADLTTPYRPALINYPDSGDSEFVMFDTGCIYEEAGDYAIIKDMETRRPIGFRWRTKSPPTAPQSSPEAASPAAGWRPTHRHYRGGLYRKLFEGTFESNLLPVIVYQNEEGRVWVRPLSEFNGYVVTEDGAGKEPRFASFWPSPPNTEDARGG